MTHPPVYTRECEIRELTEDNEKKERVIRISFSSEHPVERHFPYNESWIEILGHKPNEIDLERLNKAAPVLYNHNRNSYSNHIGVVERAWVDNKRGYAEIRISRRADLDGIWQDIKDKILRNVSISYQIHEKKLEEDKENSSSIYRVTKWTPIEISLVDIPADHTVGVERSYKPNKAKLEESMHREVSFKQTRENFIRQEKQRQSDIKKLFSPFMEHHRELALSCISDPDIPVEQARTKLLDVLGKDAEPLSKHPRLHTQACELDKFVESAQRAIEIRSGLSKEPNTYDGLTGYSLTELSRKIMEIRGEHTHSWGKRELVGRAFTHSSSDFGHILSSVANKAVLKGYTEAPEVFDQFTRKGYVSDFKTHDRVGLSEFGELDQIPESGEYKYGTLHDQKEQIQAHTYGKLFSITRKAIINDDLAMFTEIPRKMGLAARRKIGDLVFSVLTNNPKMSDGNPLFHATHKNLDSQTSSPSVDTIDKAISLMATQKDYSSSSTLNIRPAFLVVPYTLRGKAKILMSSETDPSQDNSKKPNSVKDVAQVISDARLDQHSTTAWYMLADPYAFDTIEIVYLDGNEMPFIEQQEGWHVDGAEFKVRHDFGVKALDWRTFYKNSGK